MQLYLYQTFNCNAPSSESYSEVKQKITLGHSWLSYVDFEVKSNRSYILYFLKNHKFVLFDESNNSVEHLGGYGLDAFFELTKNSSFINFNLIKLHITDMLNINSRQNEDLIRLIWNKSKPKLNMADAKEDASFFYDLLQILVTKNDKLEKILVQGKSNVKSKLFKRIIENLEDHYKMNESINSKKRKSIKVDFKSILQFIFILYFVVLALKLNYYLVISESESESVNLTSTSKNEEEDESDRELGNRTTSDLSELKYR